mmetsp:Transcript_10688/g.16370  ORF Transcript_10688/g.16370 Transcript_10688/m.16370 type:complete len:881 (+) Transcript_10688:182-2824(+)
MSYDYNFLVEKIQLYRKAEQWQESVEAFGTLSTSCPMTPFLWIQYAHDTAKLFSEEDAEDAMKVRLDTLELGLSEFPGCALLQLHFVENLIQATSFKATEEILQGLESAIQTVGKGSHCNEDMLVVQIYRQYIYFLVHNVSPKEAVNIFVQRASTPMKKGNEALQSELEKFFQENKLEADPIVFETFEDGRRRAEMYFGILKSFEDDIDESMEAEGILSRYKIDLDNINWNELLATSNDYWMGLGSLQTAQSFIKYAKACSRKTQNIHKDNERLRMLTFPIYERGVAECPTVECLWKAYIQDLSWLVEHGQAKLASKLENVASRAVSNCPYSLCLAQLQLGAYLTLANVGYAVLDPDTLLKRVEVIIKYKFLTGAANHLELYLTAIRIVKRRVLSLLVPKYDEFYDDKAEQDLPSPSISEVQEEEIQDLIEDLRDMYDTVDQFLRRSKWQEGRYHLYNDRFKTETYMLTPLLQVMDGAKVVTPAIEPFRCLEQMVKIKPQHPECYRSQIQSILLQPPIEVNDIALKLKKIRYHYQKAMKSISAKPDPILDNAKQSLCQDFLEFEQLFGSEKSKNTASRLIDNKFKDRNQNRLSRNASDSPSMSKGGQKRKQSGDHKPQKPKEKKIKIAGPNLLSTGQNIDEKTESLNQKSHTSHSQGNLADSSNEKESPDDSMANATNNTNLQLVDLKEQGLSKSNTKASKVLVGKMEYSFHPFTVRILNLAPKVQDMDLVDLLRPKCGAIVHAKIIRDKQHQHGKGHSKGWGLVQFEERDSVEKALALNDLVGLHEKTLQIHRSHMPAASLVPPGMHRINPKGEGKASKRNEKKKELKRVEKGKAELSATNSTNKSALAKNGNSKDLSLLSLQPRGVVRKINRKFKLNL